MTTLCVGDSHVNKLISYIGTRLPSLIFQDLAMWNFTKLVGGYFPGDRHLSLIIAAVPQHHLWYATVCLRGNDSDSSDPDWSIDVILMRLVTFPTQLNNLLHLQKVTALEPLNSLRIKPWTGHWSGNVSCKNSNASDNVSSYPTASCANDSSVSVGRRNSNPATRNNGHMHTMFLVI